MRNKSRAVTRGVTTLVLAAAVALGGLVVASPASAVITPVAYQVGVSDPDLATALGSDDSCALGSGGPVGYKVVRFRVSVTDSYTITDISGGSDGRIGIYTGGFNPASPATNCLSFVDVSETVPLTAGTAYTMVQSHSPAGPGSGSFSFEFDGDGTPTVLTRTTTTLTSSPNPSELSKPTVLTAVVAGGATPTGTVQFSDGTKLLGSAALAAGVARLRVSSMAVGNHTLIATYLGDATHDVSAGVRAHQVKYGPKPKVKLRVSDKSVYAGQKVKLTWKTTHADRVRASGDWKGKRASKGSMRVKVKGLGYHVYKLKATNVNGSTLAKVKLFAQRPPKNLTVSVPDSYLTVNTAVRVRVAGLDAGERFKVFLDDDRLARGTAGKRGNVSILVRVPRGTKEGEYTLSVMGGNESRVGSVPVFVLTPKALDLEVTKPKVRAGGDQTVSVSGLLEGESVTLTYLGEVLVEGTADAQGEFEYTFAVGSEVGSATVRAEGGAASRAGSASFKVLPSPGRSL